MKKKIFIVLFISLFSIGLMFSQENKKEFKVFNALLFKNTPDLSKYGFSKINLIYEDGVISTNYRVDIKDSSRRFVDLAKIISQSNSSKNNNNIPTCLDVEH